MKAKSSALTSAVAVSALLALAINGERARLSSEVCLPAVLSCEAAEPPGFLRNPTMIELALRLFQQLLNMQFPTASERYAAEALIDLAASGPEDNDFPHEGTATGAAETEEDKKRSVEAAAARLIQIVSDLLATEKAAAAEISEQTKTELTSPQDLGAYVAQKKASIDRHEKTAEAYWLYAQLRKHVSAPVDIFESMT